MSGASDIKQLADSERENQQLGNAVDLYVHAGQVYSDEGNKRQADNMFRYANDCTTIMIRKEKKI